jgi:hypothetical protein
MLLAGWMFGGRGFGASCLHVDKTRGKERRRPTTPDWTQRPHHSLTVPPEIPHLPPDAILARGKLLEDDRIIARVGKYVNRWTDRGPGDEALPRPDVYLAWPKVPRGASQTSVLHRHRASTMRDESSFSIRGPTV